MTETRDWVHALCRLLSLLIIYFALVPSVSIIDGLIEQPHPLYGQTHHVVVMGSVLALYMLFWILLDAAIQWSYFQSVARIDWAYYPRLSQLPAVFSNRSSRLTAVIGLVLIMGYVVCVEANVWLMSLHRHGSIWPPEVILCGLLLLWGALWLADCLNRRDHTTVVAAIGFTLGAALFTVVTGMGIVIE